MEKVSINTSMRLSEHFKLKEFTESEHKEVYNIPNPEALENLKRLCIWLEALRLRYNQHYVWGNGERSVSPPELGGVRGGLNKGIYSAPSDHPAHPGSPPNSGGEIDTAEPIIINSGYRSAALNKLVDGSPTSNHLTGCAADIKVYGIEQVFRYAVILMDYADETRQDYDELLVERKSGRYWLHFAVRPKNNRRKTNILQK